MDLILLIHSSIDGHLGCIQRLTIVINAAVNTGVQIHTYLIPCLYFFEVQTWSGIFGLHANSVFNSLRNYHYCFPWWLHHFPFPPSVHKGSDFSTSLPIQVIFWVSFYKNYLMDVRWYLIVILMCISLKTMMLAIFSHTYQPLGSHILSMTWLRSALRKGIWGLTLSYVNWNP